MLAVGSPMMAKAEIAGTGMMMVLVAAGGLVVVDLAAAAAAGLVVAVDLEAEVLEVAPSAVVVPAEIGKDLSLFILK